MFYGLQSGSLSNGLIAARIKWELEAEPVDAWANAAEPVDSWINVAEGSASWTDALMPHERNDEGLG